jgi:hypothetical protein
MKRILSMLAALAALSPAFPAAKAADVSVDFFYNNLSGGSWIEVGDYGYCWQPEVAVSNTNWRPYADGYWAYTDEGWTWVSYEDFGWATYHYGRWARLQDQGWVWVPGRDEDMEWGPAWVSWRTGGDYVGWAPLPPTGEPIYEGRPITGQVDVDFDIGPAYYNFVDVRYIGEPVLRERIIAPSQNVTYIQQTVNVTNITYKNKVVYNYGPDINVINTRSSRPIQRLQIQRENNVDFSAAAKSGGLTKVQGQRLMVSAPTHISKSTRQIAPPTVKTKIAKANLDAGWSGVGDAKAKEQFKQKLRSEDSSKIPQGTGAAASGQAAAGASPAGANAAGQVSTGAAPVASPVASAAGAYSATQFGKGRTRNRTGEQIQQNAVAGASASPAGAASEATGGGERGQGKHKNRASEQLQTSPGGAGTEAAAPGAAASENAAPIGASRHNRRNQAEQANPGQAQGRPADTSAEQGQGKHSGRQPEQSTGNAPAASAPGTAADQQGQGGGQHRGQGPQGANAQPSAPTGAATEGQPGQGQGKGRKHQEEASPVPSPQ